MVHSPDEHEDHEGQSPATRSREVIRAWAEKPGAKPATAPGSERDGHVGVLRFDLPGYGGGDDDNGNYRVTDWILTEDEDLDEFLADWIEVRRSGRKDLQV